MTTPPDDAPKRALTEIGDTVEPDADQDARADADSHTTDDDCPVTALGHNGTHYKFLTPTGQLIDLTAGALVSVSGLLSLFNGDPTWLTATHPRLDRKGEVVGFSVQAAGADMIRRCVAAGMFDAETRICGRGVWSLPGGEFVVHCGDALLVKTAWSADPTLPLCDDAPWQRPGRIGQTIFQARVAIARPADIQGYRMCARRARRKASSQAARLTFWGMELWSG
jgi:hypothetical protein